MHALQLLISSSDISQYLVQVDCLLWFTRQSADFGFGSMDSAKNHKYYIPGPSFDDIVGMHFFVPTCTLQLSLAACFFCFFPTVKWNVFYLMRAEDESFHASFELQSHQPSLTSTYMLGFSKKTQVSKTTIYSPHDIGVYTIFSTLVN